MFKRELLQNKFYAILLLLCTLPIIFLDGDATATVFIGMIAIPLFFAKENWICQKEGKPHAGQEIRRRYTLVDSLEKNFDRPSGRGRRLNPRDTVKNRLRHRGESRAASL